MSVHTAPAQRFNTPPALPRAMRAVVLTGHGTLDRLSFRRDWPVPRPGPGQALIEVGACGLNNTDVNTRTAWYSTGVSGATTGDALEDAGDTDAAWGGKAIAFPRIQGADVCGRVVALCAGCDASLLSRRVLVDPWLRDWSDPLNREQCGYFGSECDGGFADYTVADVRNVHVVDSDLADAELATFPTSYMTAENMLSRADVRAGDRVLISGAPGGVGSALTRGGRYTCAGAIAGPMVSFDLRTFYLRDLAFTGATVAPPGVFSNLVGYIERGEIRPVLAATYPLHDLVAAQEAFIAKRHTGNIVVTMTPDS